MLIATVLRFLFLASDIYTLVQIYALKNWDNYHAISYVPILVYRIVFTVCIGLYMVFLIFSIGTGIHIYRNHYIISSYLHSVAREINSISSYEHFCIYEQITTKSLHDWMALVLYQSLHYDFYLWLFSDTPRQVLNGATVAYTISNSFKSSNIGNIIRDIANTNKREAVLISFMTFSFTVWVLFSIKYVLLLLSAPCVIPTIKRRTGMSFSKGCKQIVADSVMAMYEKAEKKKRMSMRRKRKIPSVIKDDSMAELDVIREKSTNSDVDTRGNPFNDSYQPPSYPLRTLNSSNQGYPPSRSNGSTTQTTIASQPVSTPANLSFVPQRPDFNSSRAATMPNMNFESSEMPSQQQPNNGIGAQPPIMTLSAHQRAQMNSAISLQRPQVAYRTTGSSTSLTNSHGAPGSYSVGSENTSLTQVSNRRENQYNLPRRAPQGYGLEQIPTPHQYERHHHHHHHHQQPNQNINRSENATIPSLPDPSLTSSGSVPFDEDVYNQVPQKMTQPTESHGGALYGSRGLKDAFTNPL